MPKIQNETNAKLIAPSTGGSKKGRRNISMSEVDERSKIMKGGKRSSTTQEFTTEPSQAQKLLLAQASILDPTSYNGSQVVSQVFGDVNKLMAGRRKSDDDATNIDHA